jgi:hypothetical protein
MTSKAKDKGKDLRDETILFKVTAREKAAIEEFVKTLGDDWTVSSYIRVAVLFDMISQGNLEALNIVSGHLKEKLQEKMRALVGPRPELLGATSQPTRAR